MDRGVSGSRAAEALAKALRLAQDRDDRPLFDLLTRGSGLPGVRANAALAATFAEACVAIGRAADPLATRLATLDADRAPGGSALEFLPVCGVTALGLRGAKDGSVRARVLATLHDCAEDLRWRVREAAIDALARIGEADADALVDAVATWTDGFFQAAAVLRALAQSRWLSHVTGADAALARLDEAFALARGAERASERYPGYKALVEALGIAPGAVAARFGPRAFDLLVRWADVKEPMLREAIEANLGGRLASRYAEDVRRVREALAASAPTRRDPRTYVGPTRGRGRKRRR
jgi:hypothetical protein